MPQSIYSSPDTALRALHQHDVDQAKHGWMDRDFPRAAAWSSQYESADADIHLLKYRQKQLSIVFIFLKGEQNVLDVDSNDQTKVGQCQSGPHQVFPGATV